MSTTLGDEGTPYFPVGRPCYVETEKLTLKRHCFLSLSLKAFLSREKTRITDKLLAFFIEKKTTRNYTQMLISSIEKIVFQGIRGIKENMTSLLFKNMIPKRTFLLLGRLDIFLNIRLYPKVRSNNVSEHKKRQARRSSFYFGTPSFLSEKRGSVYEDTVHRDSKTQ